MLFGLGQRNHFFLLNSLLSILTSFTLLLCFGANAFEKLVHSLNTFIFKHVRKIEIEKLPEQKAKKVLDYVRFLIKQENEIMSSTLVSEPSLDED